MATNLPGNDGRTMSSLATYEEEKRAAISKFHQRADIYREKRINWQSYLQAQIINQEEHRIITQILQSSPIKRKDLFTEESFQKSFVQVFTTLFGALPKDEMVAYILTLLDDLLKENPTICQYFFAMAKEKHESVWQPFLLMLVRPNDFIVNMICRIVMKLACWGKSDQRLKGRELTYYVTWLKDQLGREKEFTQNICRCFQYMARIEDYRIAIIANQCAPRFLELLCENVGFQIHYQICFVFWQLTYEKDFAEQISKPKYLAAFTELIGDSAREKVVRIVCALLRNLLDVVEDKEMRKNNAVTMVHLKVLRRLSIYTEGKEIKDIELKDDLEYICKELEVRIDGISSFDEYQAEIKTRQLEWSPVHKSEKFWAENAHNLNANNYELIRILIQCLKENKDPLSICVAAHDLGQYVRYYGRGKHVLEQLGGKQIIMALLTHPDTNVRYQALLAVQKIMVHNWEYVSKSSKTDNDAPHSSSKQIATN